MKSIFKEPITEITLVANAVIATTMSAYDEGPDSVNLRSGCLG